jgi:ankyrin repeat protein
MDSLGHHQQVNRGGYRDVKKLLVDFWNAVYDGKPTAVRAALRADPTLVHSRGPDDETPLHMAVRRRRGAVAELLLEAGADVNARGGEDGATPVLSALCEFSAYDRDDVAMMELLLRFRPDLSIPNNHGVVPLNVAASMPELAAMLRQHGVGLDRDPVAHLIAALRQKGLKQVQKELEANPAQLMSPRIAEFLEFAMSCWGNRSAGFVKFLLDQGVDPDSTSRGAPLLQLAIDLRLPQVVRALLEGGAKVARLEGGGRTTLIRVMQSHRDKQIVSDLVRFGAPTDLTVEFYLLGAKEVAARIKKDPSLVRGLEDPIGFMNRAIGSKELVGLLLDLGVDPNAHGPTKPAPLRLAVRGYSFPVVKLLLERGADPNPKDAEADRPLINVAIDHTKAPLVKKIVDYLLANGSNGFADAGAHEKWMKILDRLARGKRK